MVDEPAERKIARPAYAAASSPLTRSIDTKGHNSGSTLGDTDDACRPSAATCGNGNLGSQSEEDVF